MSRERATGRSGDRRVGASLVALVLVVAVAALVAWFPGRDGTSPSRVLRAPLPADVGSQGGSWYCAARDIGAGDSPFTHTILLAGTGEAAAEVDLDGFDSKKQVGSSDLVVEPGSVAVVDVAEALGSAAQSVMVESTAPAVVEHRLVSDAGADQAPCSTFSSDTWHFPIAVTTRDASALVNLFNPFPGDASVDIEVALETGVRIPDELNGLVVSAGSTLVVDLAEHVERREQFAFTVSTRSGGVVAELTQTFDGSNPDQPVEGLRLVPGSRSASSAWSFAGGFADPQARERLVVSNPTEPEVSVLAQPIASGATDMLPEPFSLTAPALRYASIDLDDDSRVPVSVFHALDVESGDQRQVIAARSLDITGVPEDAEGFRTRVAGGTSASPGVAVAASDWMVAGVQRDEEIDGVVFVHNPGSEPVRVALTAELSDGAAEPVEYELPAGDLVAVDLETIGGTEDLFTVLVHGDAPVVVERLLTFGDVPDISLQPGVPVVAEVSDLESLGG